MVKVKLCNQGCGTHIFFQDRRPYNVSDKEKHVCPMMEMAKMYGGKWNTIPMYYIDAQIKSSYNACSKANQSRNIDEILKALSNTVDNLQRVVFEMERKEAENKEYADKLDDYKKKLVEAQERREKQKGHTWHTGDELLN